MRRKLREKCEGACRSRNSAQKKEERESESYANEEEEGGGCHRGATDRFLLPAVNITVTHRQTGVISLTQVARYRQLSAERGRAVRRPELSIIKSQGRKKKCSCFKEPRANVSVGSRSTEHLNASDDPTGGVVGRLAEAAYLSGSFGFSHTQRGSNEEDGKAVHFLLWVKKEEKEKDSTQNLIKAICQLGRFQPIAAAQMITYCPTPPALNCFSFLISLTPLKLLFFFHLPRSSHLRFPFSDSLLNPSQSGGKSRFCSQRGRF